MSTIGRKIYLFSIFSLLGITGFSQIKYAGKIEAGYLQYFFSPIIIEPGPGIGNSLDDKQSGTEINFINGIEYSKKFGAGIGIGYLNFEGIDGFSVFANLERLPKEKSLSSLANIKIGYNHIWNRFENGSGTIVFEICTGAHYRLSDRLGIYLQVGIAGRLQTVFIPMKIGVKF